MSWTDGICLSADDLRQRGMACILLWMGGGPSQFETFDPKPHAPAEIRGLWDPTPTNVPGMTGTSIQPLGTGTGRDALAAG